jgi:hypothetical protein
MLFHDIRDCINCRKPAEEFTRTIANFISVAPICALSGYILSSDYHYMALRWLAGACFISNLLSLIDHTFRLIILPLGLCRLPSAAVQNWPITSRSLWEFWSCRWNTVIQRRMLKPFVYMPVFSRLHAKLGRRLARAVATFITFAVSGLWHAMPLWKLAFDSTVHSSSRRRTIVQQGWLVFAFFLLQLIGILFERAVNVYRWRSRIAQRFWTIGYITICSPLIIEPLLLNRI